MADRVPDYHRRVVRECGTPGWVSHQVHRPQSRHYYVRSHQLGASAARVFMNWFGQQQDEGFEYHLLVIGIAAALLATGGSRWSADRMVMERL